MRYRRDTERAFHWIMDIVRRHRVPYQITGGMAAHIYGSGRPVIDIDLDMREGDFERILPEVRKYIVIGPKHWTGEGFKVYLMRLKYRGHQIDIGGSDETLMWNKRAKRWEPCPTDLGRFAWKTVLDRRVKVIRKDDLVAYKRLRDRKVDREDVSGLH